MSGPEEVEQERRQSLRERREHYWSLDKPELVELLVRRDVAIQTRDHENAALIKQVYHDDLTNVLSRSGLYYVLGEWKKQRRSGSLLFIDCDKFKIINDRQGHDQGDRTLARVAKVLRHITRTDDSVGRWGGDEFGVLLPDTPLAKAAAVAVRAQAQLVEEYSDEYHKEGRELVPTLSIGVAETNYRLGPEQMFQDADRAMYEAKRAGGDQVYLAPQLLHP